MKKFYIIVFIFSILFFSVFGKLAFADFQSDLRQAYANFESNLSTDSTDTGCVLADKILERNLRNIEEKYYEEWAKFELNRDKEEKEELLTKYY